MKNLDPILHSQLRLAVMSVLMNVEEADFVYLKQQTESTSGNLSIQLDKLAAAQYITIEKGFQGGGDKLREQGIKVESLAIVESMDHETGQVFFRD